MAFKKKTRKRTAKRRTAAHRKPRARRRTMTGIKRRATRRKGSAAGAMSLTNVALAIGGGLAFAYLKDNATLSKYIPNAKARYAALAGVGLLGAGVGGYFRKAPAQARPLLLGMGLAGGVVAAVSYFPKLAPGPADPGAVQGIGRLSAAQVQELRDRIAASGMNGRGGRGSSIMGYRGGRGTAIMGARSAKDGTRSDTIMGQGRRSIAMGGGVPTYIAPFS